MEELKSEATTQRPADGRVVDLSGQGGNTYQDNAGSMDAAALPAYDTSDITQTGLAHDTSVDGYNPFMDWQTSDWLELDASVC